MDKFTLTNFGDATHILGIGIIQDKERGTTCISQAPYGLLLLGKCGIADYNPVEDTPGIGNELTMNPRAENRSAKKKPSSTRASCDSSPCCAGVRALTSTLRCHRRRDP